MAAPRQYTWHLRASKTPERARFTSFAIEHGWETGGGSTHPNGGADRVFRREGQSMMVEFYGQHFQSAWLYVGTLNGVKVSDTDLVARFITEPLHWAAEHVLEWESEHEGAVVDRAMRRA